MATTSRAAAAKRRREAVADSGRERAAKPEGAPAAGPEREPAASPRRAAASPRHAARELVLKGLYERQVGGNAANDVRGDLAAGPAYARADQAYFEELWAGVTSQHDALLERVAPLLSRKPAELSPIERAILVIGAWELVHRLEIPYKAVIDEAIELAKTYGGTDGHRFVNGVLDRLAAEARTAEIAALAR